jgi:TolB protein
VGPGWFLAEWSPPVTPAPTTLFLIDPAGGRYLIETFPASSPASTPTVLAGWSGDGERALLKTQDSSGPMAAAVLNLRTLATTQFELADGVYPVGFTAPDGLAIIANVFSGPSQARLERLSLSGNLELSYPTSFPGGRPYSGEVLYSPDGTELAAGTSGGVELLSNDGQSLRFLSVADPSTGSCSPVRWWTRQELLVGCGISSTTPGQQLWRVPTSGATPTALTANPPAGQDQGDMDAWLLSTGRYVTDLTACGQTYLAEVQPDGQTAPVAVPSLPASDNSSTVLGAQGDRLAIASGVAPICGTTMNTLLWYAPSTNSVTTLLGGTVNGGTIETALMFGAP